MALMSVFIDLAVCIVISLVAMVYLRYVFSLYWAKPLYWRTRSSGHDASILNRDNFKLLQPHQLVEDLRFCFGINLLCASTFYLHLGDESGLRIWEADEQKGGYLIDVAYVVLLGSMLFGSVNTPPSGLMLFGSVNTSPSGLVQALIVGSNVLTIGFVLGIVSYIPFLGDLLIWISGSFLPLEPLHGEGDTVGNRLIYGVSFVWISLALIGWASALAFFGWSHALTLYLSWIVLLVVLANNGPVSMSIWHFVLGVLFFAAPSAWSLRRQ